LQCAICGGGAASSETLDASWCNPEPPRGCIRPYAPRGVRHFRSPPVSDLEGDSGHLDKLSMCSACRPTYTCDAAYTDNPDLQLYAGTSSNANGGEYLFWGPQNQMAWAYDNSDDLQRPYFENATYLQHWGLSPKPSLPCSAPPAVGNARLLPTTGSCYVNQPPYWVEECYFGNVRSFH
jgi:hypothetical protein